MKIVYFAWVREQIGCDEEPAPEGAVTVADMLDLLRGKGGGHAAALADESRLRFALDQLMVKIANDSFRMRTMITEVITSYLFTHRKVRG